MDPRPPPAFRPDGPAPPRRIDRRFAAGRAILALMLREMSTRFGRTPGGYLWIVLQPLGVIVLLALGMSLLSTAPGLGTSFFLFKATGYLPLLMFRNLSQTIGNALTFSRPLLDYPGVTWIDAVLARFALNALALLMVAVLILAGTVLLEGLTPILDWPAIVLATALSLALGLGVGVLNCVLFMRFDVWQQAWGILTTPLIIVSGVFLLYEDLPRTVQDLLWYNPILHITGLMRAGFYPSYTPSYISVPYVLAWVLVPLVFGLMLLRRFHRTLLER